MARDNQGLHAALIVFVVLTIILAVSTFVFFSQSNNLAEERDKYREDADKAWNAARDKDKIMKEFQRIMGFAPTDSSEKIHDDFKEDMQKYAPTDVEESALVYRQVLRRQNEVIKLRNQSLNDEIQKCKDLDEKYAKFKRTTNAELAQFKSRAEQAEKDQQRESLQFQKDRDRLEKMQRNLASDLDRASKDHEEQLNKKQVEIASLSDKLTVMIQAYESVKGTVDKMRQELPDEFHGKICRINQRSGTVWINRGRDDALRPQTKFSIFPAGASNNVEVDKKGRIEVTRILDGHLAEARIVDDDPLNPILIGDKIYTPVWNLGERRHFALAGFIDLDGDGRSDLGRMHTLIETSGGVVDARMDGQGARNGKMTFNTRYLVLGDEPDANASPELREDYVQITNQAERLRIETIPFKKLLESMGWIRQVNVARFGAGGYGQFPVERDTTPSVSRGRISDLFKPRHPPGSRGGSAY